MKTECEICHANPLTDNRIILRRTAPLGVEPAGWRCQNHMPNDNHSKADMVICPSCAHQFEAVSVMHQQLLRKMLGLYLDTVKITSDNIGDYRRTLFVPFDCGWNGDVREATADRENRSGIPPCEVREESAPVGGTTTPGDAEAV